MKRIIKFYNVFVLLITVCCILFFGIFTLPRIFQITPFIVRSSSMEPEIPTGSVVFTNGADKDVEVGDVITFGLKTGKNKREKETGVYVTHRVSRVLEGGELIQTKGDANDVTDGYLTKDAIVGTVILHIPKLGFLLNYLEQNHGYLQVVGLIFTLNVISYVINEQTDVSTMV